MTTNQLPIIVPVDERDDITHTAQWPQCKDETCPCQLEVEDAIILTPPTEEQLDAQEKAVLRPFSAEWELDQIRERRAALFDISRELAQIRNLTTQTDDGSWW